MEYVRAKQADKKRLVVAITALVVLLCLSYVAVGGIVFYVIKMTKDTRVAAGSTELTDTSGNTLHVMSTTAMTVTSAVSSLDSDNVFEDLQSVSLNIGVAPLTLKSAGFLRVSPGHVLLFTASAAIPVLELKDTTLSPGPGASEAVLALVKNATASGGSRGLASYCGASDWSASCVCVCVCCVAAFNASLPFRKINPLLSTYACLFAPSAAASRGSRPQPLVVTLAQLALCVRRGERAHTHACPATVL